MYMKTRDYHRKETTLLKRNRLADVGLARTYGKVTRLKVNQKE